MLILDKNIKLTLTISLSSIFLNLSELVTSTVFDGYTGIQSTNEMDVCCPNHSSSDPKNEKGDNFEQSFHVVDS